MVRQAHHERTLVPLRADFWPTYERTLGPLEWTFGSPRATLAYYLSGLRAGRFSRLTLSAFQRAEQVYTALPQGIFDMYYADVGSV